MAKRRSMSRRKSKRLFKRTANRTRRENIVLPNLRGGRRL